MAWLYQPLLPSGQQLAQTILVGVSGTGGVGSLSSATGTIPSVYGTGRVGIIVPSTLMANPRRTLSNVVRRLRTLSSQDPAPI